MEPKLEELLKFVNEDDQVRILGIWGMGGVGKTTLLKKLNNELSKTNLVIWVVVSKDMNLQNVQKKIAKSLNLTRSDESDLDTTAGEIFRALKKKKFVLLLDDIWQRIDLESIGVPSFDSNSSHEIKKSMVVFTTRSEEVCGQMEAHRKMQIECLNESEAWSLFQEKVGNGVIHSHPQILELAKDVAKECHGLPLALITIGRTMASKKKVPEWRNAKTVLRNSASEFPGMKSDVLQILKFSYDNLRSEKVKSCFLYCSLFNEDHLISTEEMIDFWIAEGFIDNFENINEARDQGHDIIGYLNNVSLLENSSGFGVQMHDLIRDLAISIVSPCRRNKGKYLTNLDLEHTVDECEKAEKISVMTFRFIRSLSTNRKDLSTLVLLRGISGETASGSLACDNMPALRVVSIVRYPMFPANIGQLSELRYLDLRGFSLDFSPDKLMFMVKLMFLRFGRISIEVPSGVIPCLTQLRVLDLYDSDFKDWEMEGCASLKELESLRYLNDLGIKIGNLLALEELVSTSKFQLITTRLSIKLCEGITSVSLSKSSPSLSFANLKNLRTLEIQGCEELQELTISPWGMQALENLHLIRLPKLEIVWDNIQLVFPAADQLKEEQLLCLSHLQHVEISECISINNLTWLAYAHDLKSLRVSWMDGIEEIISDEFPADEHTELNMFSSLTTISLSDLLNLRRICSNSLAFPVLEYIDVISCPKLKKLPLHRNENNTLKGIIGEKEWWERLEWDHATVKYHFSSLFC